MADLALGCHTDAHAIVDAGRDRHRDIAALFYAAVARALITGIFNDFAKALALRARASSHYITQKAALHLLDFAHTIAVTAGDGLGFGVRAGATAGVTQHRGIDGDLLF